MASAWPAPRLLANHAGGRVAALLPLTDRVAILAAVGQQTLEALWGSSSTEWHETGYFDSLAAALARSDVTDAELTAIAEA